MSSSSTTFRSYCRSQPCFRFSFKVKDVILGYSCGKRSIYFLFSQIRRLVVSVLWRENERMWCRRCTWPANDWRVLYNVDFDRLRILLNCMMKSNARLYKWFFSRRSTRVRHANWLFMFSLIGESYIQMIHFSLQAREIVQRVNECAIGLFIGE
jgi:hypothetical protein